MNPHRHPGTLVCAVATLSMALAALAGAAPPAEAERAAAAPRAMTANDALKWKRISATSISPDGKWVAYQIGAAEGDSTVMVRAVEGEKQYTFDIGEGMGAPVFSDDSAWIAFATFPKSAEAKQLKKSRKPIQRGASLVNLSSGKRVDYTKVKGFGFPRESSAVFAVHRSGGDTPPAPPSEGASKGRPAPKGSDLIVRNLSSGQEFTLGAVAEYAFDKPGRWLAWTIATDDQVGSSINLRNLRTGVVTTLDSDKARYERLAWSEEGDALVVLKGVENKAYEEPLYSVIGIADVAKSLRTVQYDPGKDTSFPAGMRISPNRVPRWTADRQALLFGIDEAERKDGAREEDGEKKDEDSKGEQGAGKDNDDRKDGPKAEDKPDVKSAAAKPRADEDKPDLVIWHWKDPRLQSEQQVQEGRDRNYSYLATWRIADKKFIRLSDDDLREVSVPEKGRWALGSQSKPYDLGASLDGRRFQDAFVVDLVTGARKPIGKQMRWVMGQSPDSNKVLYFTDRHFHVFDAQTGRSVNLTAGMPVSFVNVEDDHNVTDPPTQAMGWTSDSRAVLLSDLWDVWMVPVDGGMPVNLTANGRAEQIRYRRVPVDREEKGIDLSRPQYFSMLGEWTKRAGFARLQPRQRKIETLVFDDAAYGNLARAEDSSTLIYSRSTPVAYPDVYVADAQFRNARRLSDGQAQLAAYQWSAGARLVDYQSDSPREGLKGKKLQASLFLPAGYEPGRRYPTIVYIYEHLSDNMNVFTQPDVRGFNTALYTSNGYAVLMPDISYVMNDPGMSAVWCVLPALKAAIASGVVDPERVGLQGHSWGGYQTSFLVTQTNMFKAAIAGAPLTNMVSMYSLVYKNSGVGNMAIFESSQGRFTGGYWDNWDAYVRNSPVARAKDVQTPLVILHNDRDGAVDFTQGVEYYNTLRRLGKPVTMLQYVGENHGLEKPANKYDYTIRMQEFFDHYLKGAPAPDWWAEGVARKDMEEHLKARLPSTREPKVAEQPSTPKTDDKTAQKPVAEALK